MAETLKDLNSPDKIAEQGEFLYERVREEYEKKFMGQFVAIDVRSGDAYVGEYPETAMQKARAASPNAVLHLIRIGSQGAFKVSYTGARHHNDWWGRALRPSR